MLRVVIAVSEMAERPIPGDQARATVTVAVAPEQAFRIFTEEIDLWWRRGRKYRIAGRQRGSLALERQVGGRVFESYEVNGQQRVAYVGRIIRWEPPSLLVFEWRPINFVQGEKTEVEVVFERCLSGQTVKTQVTVTHRGWANIRPDHPARHGCNVAEFLRMNGLWWGDLMTSLRQHVIAQVKGGPPPLATTID